MVGLSRDAGGQLPTAAHTLRVAKGGQVPPGFVYGAEAGCPLEAGALCTTPFAFLRGKGVMLVGVALDRGRHDVENSFALQG